MKLTHIALVLTIALLGVTGWLAWDQHNQSAGARNELEMYQRREAAGARFQNAGATQNAMLQKEQQILAMQAAAANEKSAPPVQPLSAAPPIALEPPKPPPAAPTPPPVSALQHKVMSMPALAKVIEANQGLGFVVINAGFAKKVSVGNTFLLRRGSAIVARIKISTPEETTSVADLDSKTIPAGVRVEVGDEVIQDMPEV